MSESNHNATTDHKVAATSTTDIEMFLKEATSRPAAQSMTSEDELSSSPCTCDAVEEEHALTATTTTMTTESPSEHNAEEKQEDDSAAAAAEKPSALSRCCHCLAEFWESHHFPLLILLAIGLAKAHPTMGDEWLQPHITAAWVAVILCFLISGICLKLDELWTASKRIYFNTFVQVFNFGVVSSVVFGVTRLLQEVGAVSGPLGDGMIICSCLPVRTIL